MEIRSYRSVFDLERRLYRIDRFRLNPSGVPVRGLVYVALLVLAVLVAQRLPVVGALVRVLPWQVRYAALPGGCAALLTMLRIDGRTAQAALASTVRFSVSPRHLHAFVRCPRAGACWTPRPLSAIDDEAREAPVTLRGPGAVLVRAPHRVERRGARGLRLTVDPAGSGAVAARVIRVTDGVALRVAAARRR